MLRSMRWTSGLLASLFLVAVMVSGCGEPGEPGGQPPQQAPMQ